MAKKKETNPTGVPEEQSKAQSADHINTQVDGLKITLPAVSGKGKGESSIMKDFRRSDWLYNPVVYTQISGDFTLMQQRVFIGVVEKLQDRILDSITEQKRTKQWPMLFSPAEMNENIDLRIDARSLGVPPERYPELKQALEQLMGMKFGYVKHRGKTTTYEMGVLFHYISMDVPDDLVKRNGEFTVNIALIDNKQPVLGVIYAPVLDKLWTSEDKNHSTLNTQHSTFTVLVSRSHRTPEVDAYINKVLRPAHPDLVIDTQGSSLKFARLAEGSADVYVCYSKTKEWDTAAADAILRATGGKVLRISDGQPLEYSKKEYPNPPFVAWAK